MALSLYLLLCHSDCTSATLPIVVAGVPRRPRGCMGLGHGPACAWLARVVSVVRMVCAAVRRRGRIGGHRGLREQKG